MEKMSEKLKPALLVVYMLASLAMILGLWGAALLKPDDSQPGFYRATFTPDAGFSLTSTALAGNPAALTLTPEATHRGSGQRLNPSPTPGPTASPTAVEATEPVDQVN